ncbi:DUF58 domain-containing protein [Candidatus Magnetomonas plexicatena]|uniref:DUF58 domain-containing protein n=1 Tax=Candidatus Magnetomonas plexicatena TaxID=2552947 RepID=UPI001C798773|nr:DUF58 domain-containing protein [Nitrospirales bacterium LBB_01]
MPTKLGDRMQHGIKVNKAGTIYIVLSILIGVSATNTGNNLIYLITAAILSFMAISGAFGRKNIFKLQVMLEFPDDVYANREFPLRVTLINQKTYLPASLVRVRVYGNEILFPYVGPNAKEQKTVQMQFPHRGITTIDSIEVSSVYPFNLFTRYRQLEIKTDIVVYPEPRKCSIPLISEKTRFSKGESSSDRAGYDSELISVRDYVAGDPLKYVHWKATARTGTLKTKELSSLTFQPVVIDFENFPVESLENRISGITYLIIELSKKKTPIGLKTKGKIFKPDTSSVSKRSMLRHLALLPSQF